MNMSEGVMLQVIEYIVNDDSFMVHVQFFGGEPLIRWEQLQEFVIIAKEKAKIKEKNIQFGMTTNGTLLDEKKLTWLKENNISFLLSHDGIQKAHDHFRKYANGRGSFDDIDLALISKYFPDIQIRPTITPETIEFFADSVRFFARFGFRNIATEPAYEKSVNWKETDFQKLAKVYEELASMYAKAKLQGEKPFIFKFIEDARRGIRNQKMNIKPAGFLCGIGKNSYGIDAMGRIYPCQRYASNLDPRTVIGDVWNGIEKDKLENFWWKIKRENMKSFANCKECKVAFACFGGCNACNYEEYGDPLQIHENFCEYLRVAIPIGVKALKATKEVENGD